MAETEASGRGEPEWPWGTLVVSAVLLAVYFAECAVGLDDPQRGTTLVRTGAVNYAYVFEAGEWWRLFGAAFCHHDIVHLLMNGWALIQLGALVEDIYGRERFLVVYLLSCLGSSLASAAIGAGPSVGASGGIMGLIGFLIAARYVHEPEVRDFLRLVLGRQLLFWTAFILGVGGLLALLGGALGPSIPRVDNYGHLGGLLTGLALAAAIRGTREASLPLRGAAAALAALALVSLGFVAARGDESARLEQAFYDTVIAHEKGDVAAIASGLDAIDAIPGKPRRAVGRDVNRASELTFAGIAAVRTSDALLYGRLAAELDPDLGGAVLALARLAAGEEVEPSSRLEHYRKTASIRDLVDFAFLLEKQGRSVDAVLFFEAALARSPDDARLQNNVAWTLLMPKDARARDATRALLLARRASVREPGDAAILDTLAEAEFQNGLVELALAHEEKAVAIALANQDPQSDTLVERLHKIRAAAR